MLRKFFWLAALGTLSVALLPSAARAQEYLDQGTYELTLSGTGSSNEDIDAGQFGIAANLGYFVTDQLELSLRQTLDYADFNAGTTVNASTGVAVDFHFDLDRWQPFIGAAIGYAYGDNSDTFFAGPEAGVKYFVKADTFIYGLVQYQFFFDDGDDAQSAFDDGSFLYQLGIGFTW